jgi:hypothetical protein
MKLESMQKAGGVTIILGGLLLAVYALIFVTLLPVGEARKDASLLVLNPHWRWLAALAGSGLILLMFGFAMAYTRMFATAGKLGFGGLLLVEFAYLQQTSKVTWEIFIYPVLANHTETLPLLSRRLLAQDAFVVGFRTIGSLAIFAGIICFCAALIRSHVFSKLSGSLILGGALLYGLGPMLTTSVALIGIVVFSVGCVTLGRHMLCPETTGSAPMAQTASGSIPCQAVVTQGRSVAT